MKLSKTMKKVLAIVLSLAMVVTSVTVNNAVAKAADEVTNIEIAAKLEANSTTQIRADWTNPEGTVRVKCYVNEENENNYAKAANGWVWSVNDPAGVRTNLDTVSGTNGGIDFANGGTFTIIVVAYSDEACTQVIGRGVSNEVTIEAITNTDLGLFVERYDEGNMLAFLKWSKVSGAAKYVAYDADGNQVAESNGDWTQVTLPSKNTDYVYTVKAYDAAGNEITGITNYEATARIDGEEEQDPSELGYTLITNDETEQAITGNWSAIVQASNKVYYKTVDNGFAAYCASNANNWTQYATKYVYKATGLKADTTYTFTADVNASGADYTLSCDDVKWYNEAKNQTSVQINETVTTDAEGNATITVLAGIVGLKVELAFTNAALTEGEVAPETTTEAPVDPETTEVAETTEEPTDAPEPTEAPTAAPQPGYNPGFDPASLTYTNLACEGTAGMSIDYAIQNATIEGVVPWYGDGGITFQVAYADPKGEGTAAEVLVNGAAPADGVVTLQAAGIIKINPTLLADNAYSVITVKLATAGEMTLVIKKGTPAVVEPTTEAPTVAPETTEAPTAAPETTEAPTVDPETTTSGELTFTTITGQEADIEGLGNWSMWLNPTHTMEIAVDPEDADHIQAKMTANSNNWDAWAIQYKASKSGLTPGENYTMEIDFSADTADFRPTLDGTNFFNANMDQTSTTVVATVTADADGKVGVVVGLGLVGIGVTVDISNVVVKDAEGNVVDTTTPEVPTSEVPETTEAPTPVETTTVAPETSDNLLDAATFVGYVGVPSGWYESGCDGTVTEGENGDVTVDIKSTGGWDGSEWGFQATYENIAVTIGKEYTYKATLVSDKDKVVLIKVSDSADNEIHLDTVNLKANEPYEYEVTFTAEVTPVKIVHALGSKAAEGVVNDCTVVISGAEFTQVAEETTEAPTTEAPTTVAPETTTVAPVETTTVAPTTAKQDTTTVAPTTKAPDKKTVKKPAKVKIKKVNAKKKSAKKVKISLKKVKGAVGYQIAIYKVKKNAKKNKKALVKKIVTKRKVTITSKKLKNKKKLFVRARAYVLKANGKKLYGKWSKIKKVKIKK